MYDGFSHNFSFGFADISKAAWFDALPGEKKRILAQRAPEFYSLEEAKRFAEQLKPPHGKH